ncbi:MAG: hypothetical protein M0000_13205 [Actinomycetota bacterium]|nr:hypothetical protein [Actinomycetota bacterium]
MEPAKTEPTQSRPAQPKPAHELVVNVDGMFVRCNLEPADGKVPDCWLVPNYAASTGDLPALESAGECMAGDELMSEYDHRIVGAFSFPAEVAVDRWGNPTIAPQGFGL